MYELNKRIIDVFAALAAIIILSPILIFVICILRLTGEKEVFYLQERVGYKNAIFKIIKFATMLKNSPNIGNRDVTLRDDPRVTKFGKYLRESKINELPQLFNILKGDISLVGPRPLMKAGFDRYSNEFRKLIYNVKPGLTGIGSIVFRDEEKILTNSKLQPHECYEKIILPVKGELEMWYQNNRSTLTDLKIIFMTAWAIIFPTTKLHQKWFKKLPEFNL
jgi:lipopolysaccharide/colanic/teichoic acid biosynthesis glycosyltransferase